MHLFSRRTYLRAHQTGHVSDTRSSFISASGGNCTLLAARALQYTVKGASACVACIISVTLRTCLWNGFPNCPGAAQHCLHHLTHSIQLVSSLKETEMCPTWNGSEKTELKENTMRVRSIYIQSFCNGTFTFHEYNLSSSFALFEIISELHKYVKTETDFVWNFPKRVSTLFD